MATEIISEEIFNAMHIILFSYVLIRILRHLLSKPTGQKNTEYFSWIAHSLSEHKNNTFKILKFKVSRSEKPRGEKMSGRRRRAERNTQMNDATAASAIQSWFSGNVSRNKMEETRVNSNMEKGGTGASSYQAESRLRRRSTMRLSKVHTCR